MLRHLLQSIETVLRTNKATDGFQKEPISTKNLRQGDDVWSKTKTVLVWELENKEYHLRLTPKRELKVRAALGAIPTKARQVSFRKWWHLLGILRSVHLAVAGAQGMFTRLLHALWQAQGRRVTLSTTVHDELSAWRQLIHKLAARPPHLRELDPSPPTWE